jgi:hypothetical protein
MPARFIKLISQSDDFSTEHIEDLKQITDEYRRVRKARARLVRLQGQLLAIVDQMQELRVAQGERELDKIRSTASRSRR